jgi:hypothetical protein
MARQRTKTDYFPFVLYRTVPIRVEMYTHGVTAERLVQLQGEYEETVKRLRFPMSFEELHRLKGRRKAILDEARILGNTLNLVGDQWFSREAQ